MYPLAGPQVGQGRFTFPEARALRWPSWTTCLRPSAPLLHGHSGTCRLPAHQRGQLTSWPKQQQTLVLVPPWYDGCAKEDVICKKLQGTSRRTILAQDFPSEVPRQERTSCWILCTATFRRQSRQAPSFPDLARATPQTYPNFWREPGLGWL